MYQQLADDISYPTWGFYIIIYIKIILLLKIKTKFYMKYSNIEILRTQSMSLIKRMSFIFNVLY